MNSRDTTQLPDSKLSLRVRLWKDKAGAALVPTMSSHGDGWVYKASLSSPTWIKTIAIDLANDESIPKEFIMEVSDYGAYSLLATTCNQGSSSCVVDSIAGFQVGRNIIFRGNGETAKFTITEVDTGTNTITFNGLTPVEFSTGNYSTVEDDRWYKVVDSMTNTTGIITFGDITDTEPMVAFYGQYIRVAPVRQESIIRLTSLTLHEDDYFDLTAYLDGGLSYEQDVDIVEASSQLPNVSLKFLNIDDNFNRRNTSSIYIENGINYVNTPKRMTVEWLAHEADWKQALNTSDEPDWVLECSFTTRRWSIARDEHSYATVSGETLNRISKNVDIPMLEVMNVGNIIEDWILMQRHRQNLLEVDGDKTKFRLAVFEDNTISRTHTTFNETIGRGTFGRPTPLFSDPADKQPSLIYAGHFGLACDGNYLYSCHTMQDYNGLHNHGMFIIKRYLNGTPVGSDGIFYFFEADTGNDDICGGDICIVGTKMWLHTSQLGVTYNVYEIDMASWTVDNKYAKLGNYGHYPIHACSLAGDNDHIIALYDGGAEGRVIYKINVADYTSDWSHTMDATMFSQVDYPFGGLISVGSTTLMLISKASNVCDSDRKKDSWYAIILDINAGVPYISRNRIIEFTAPIFPEISDSVSSSMCEPFGWASIAQTNMGVVAMTGPAQPNKPSSKEIVGSSVPKWESHSGGFSNIGRLHYYLQNGHVINDRDEYTSPNAEKDYCNYSLEQISLNGEILDNGLQDDGSFTATYNGDVKTTGDYEINLRTGEIYFLLPPYANAEVKASYDFKATVPYFQSEKESRWELIRQIAQANAGVCYVSEKERVVFRLRREQEDIVVTTSSRDLRSRNIIHSSNTAYGIDTIQVANAEHNTFYVQGQDFTISYNSGVYTITSVGDTILNTHLVITYLVGPSDDVLPVLDNTGQLRGANIVSIDEEWDIGDMSNSIVIQGKKMNPAETPTVITETFAVSPLGLNIDTSFSRVQLAQTEGIYNWNDEKRMFETDDSQNNINNSGLVLDFQDPLIIGTTAWRIREPNTSHVEEKSTSEGGATAWKKLTWTTPFYEIGTDEETTNYDVILTNPNYWRLANLEDTKEDSFKAAAGGDTYKTGAYIYIKKFRGTIAESQNCTAYAYQTKDTGFYVDASGKLTEGSISSTTNPLSSASPDKTIEILLEPVTSTNAHLFRTPATYDGVAIGADYCMSIGTVNIDYNGLTVNLYNYAAVENYIKVRVVGYPVTSTADIKATCENRINFNATLSSIETYGEQPMTIENKYIQSLGMGKTIGYSLLDWLKEPHSIIQVSSKFGLDIKLLNPVLVSSSYGNFSETTELWLVVKKSTTIEKGENNLNTTVLDLIDVPNNPSAEPDTSS